VSVPDLFVRRSPVAKPVCASARLVRAAKPENPLADRLAVRFDPSWFTFGLATANWQVKAGLRDSYILVIALLQRARGLGETLLIQREPGRVGRRVDDGLLEQGDGFRRELTGVFCQGFGEVSLALAGLG